MTKHTRMHLRFILLAITIALPPLLPITGLIYWVLEASARRQIQEERARAARIAEAKEDRARILAYRALP